MMNLDQIGSMKKIKRIEISHQRASYPPCYIMPDNSFTQDIEKAHKAFMELDEDVLQKWIDRGEINVEYEDDYIPPVDLDDIEFKNSTIEGYGIDNSVWMRGNDPIESNLPVYERNYYLRDKNNELHKLVVCSEDSGLTMLKLEEDKKEYLQGDCDTLNNVTKKQ